MIDSAVDSFHILFKEAPVWQNNNHIILFPFRGSFVLVYEQISDPTWQPAPFQQ